MANYSTTVYIFILLGIILTILAIISLVKAVKKREWGNAAIVLTMLLIAVGGWTISLTENNLKTASGNPNLVLTDQIETKGSGILHFTYITVLNRGTVAAKNCVIEIELRESEAKDYEYLGYASYQNDEFMPHTESRFSLLNTISYDQGTTWVTRIILRDVRDYIDEENKIELRNLRHGEYFIRLKMSSENAESSPSEYRLFIPQGETVLPKLEAVLE